MPLAAAEFCRVLPPPVCYEGPFVIVDRLMEVFSKFDFGDKLKSEFFPAACFVTKMILKVVAFLDSWKVF